MAKVSYGFACLAAIALTVSVSAKELQTIGNGTYVPAIKAMAVTMNPDGTVTPKGDWVMLNNQGGDGTGASASSLNLFDAFENDGTACPGPAAPFGGVNCGLPGESYRWFFGPSYNNPFTVGENDAESNGEADRAQFGWFWFCGHTGTEDCYIAIFTGDTHDNTCGAAYNLIDGVVFGFGPLNCNPAGYYYTDVCGLIDLGVPITTYTNGVDGAVVAKAFDGETLTLGHGQLMLWGENSGNGDLAGEHDDISYDDDAPVDGVHTPFTECYSYAFGICPDPLHHMVGLEGVGEGPCASETCNGSENLKATAKDKNGECLVKGKVTNGTVGSVYGITMPSGDCIQKAANSRGIAKAKERPSVSGTVAVPSCGLSKAVSCP